MGLLYHIVFYVMCKTMTLIFLEGFLGGSLVKQWTVTLI